MAKTRQTKELNSSAIHVARDTRPAQPAVQKAAKRQAEIARQETDALKAAKRSAA